MLNHRENTTRMNSVNSSKKSGTVNQFNRLNLAADFTTGTSLGLVNDWSLIGANVGVIALRLLLEFVILKIRKKRKNGNP
jgi:hypothetical protein